MNKNIILSLLILPLFLFVPNTFCAEITPSQKEKATRILESYTSYMEKLHNLPKKITNMERDKMITSLSNNIQDLFCHRLSAYFFDEISGKSINIYEYEENVRNLLYDQYSITYPDIQSAHFEGWYKPSLKSEEEKTEYISISVLKIIKGPEGTKERVELILVSLNENKIFSVVDENSLRPGDLYAMALKRYNEKDYDNALQLYEKTIHATNNIKNKNIQYYNKALDLYKNFANVTSATKTKEYQSLQQFFSNYYIRCASLYSAAIMYIKKQGCKSMKRKERDDRAYDLLIESRDKGVNKAYYALEALGVYQ